MCSPQQSSQRSIRVQRFGGSLILLTWIAACSSAGNGTTNANLSPAAANSGARAAQAMSGAGADGTPLAGVGVGVGVAGASSGVSAGSVSLQPSAAGTAGRPDAAGVSGGPGASGGAGALAAGSGGAAHAESGSGASAEFALMSIGTSTVSATEVGFPANALPPTNASPEFSWTGVPKDAKSLTLVFRDLSAGAVKWVLWDIPPTVTHVPSGVAATPNPSEVPGSSQLGSLGNQGYAGPCCVNNQYEWVLWALDVDKLPGVAGLSTAQIRNSVLPAHEVAATKPLIMRIMP